MGFDSLRDTIYMTQNLHVSASRCHLQGVTITKVCAPTCQFMFFFFCNYKVHYNILKIHKIDIVNKLRCFDNKLIISHLNSQLLVSVF